MQTQPMPVETTPPHSSSIVRSQRPAHTQRNSFSPGCMKRGVASRKMMPRQRNGTASRQSKDSVLPN